LTATSEDRAGYRGCVIFAGIGNQSYPGATDVGTEVQGIDDGFEAVCDRRRFVARGDDYAY
jgi:hypothetical protein